MLTIFKLLQINQLKNTALPNAPIKPIILLKAKLLYSFLMKNLNRLTP